MTSETKLDENFPVGQFLIKGFSTPFRLDRNSHGGGVLLYFREDNTFETSIYRKKWYRRFLRRSKPKSKKKWLLICSYNLHKALIGSHVTAFSKSTDLYTSKYLLGDFNAEIEVTSIKNFLQ